MTPKPSEQLAMTPKPLEQLAMTPEISEQPTMTPETPEHPAMTLETSYAANHYPQKPCAASYSPWQLRLLIPGQNLTK